MKSSFTGEELKGNSPKAGKGFPIITYWGSPTKEDVANLVRDLANYFVDLYQSENFEGVYRYGLVKVGDWLQPRYELVSYVDGKGLILDQSLLDYVGDTKPVKQRNWLPVKYTPLKGERVIVTDGTFVGEAYLNSNGKWIRYCGSLYGDGDIEELLGIKITHWMPMPIAPKKEKENE